MRLSKVERLILCNQYAILEKTDPANSKEHEQAQKVFSHGYSGLYSWFMQHIDDDIQDDVSQEVIDILTMFHHIENGWRALNKHGEDLHPHLVFAGFDKDAESGHYAIAQFLTRDLGRFGDFSEIL